MHRRAYRHQAIDLQTPVKKPSIQARQTLTQSQPEKHLANRYEQEVQQEAGTAAHCVDKSLAWIKAFGNRGSRILTVAVPEVDRQAPRARDKMQLQAAGSNILAKVPNELDIFRYVLQRRNRYHQVERFFRFELAHIRMYEDFFEFRLRRARKAIVDVDADVSPEITNFGKDARQAPASAADLQRPYFSHRQHRG